MLGLARAFLKKFFLALILARIVNFT